ncbi:uncharacterized protein TNCV_4913571 [Trichonephila clavipes]|nr:uncharacterized protein TNCV_4913571 [Trichonephila clavipes]
MALSLSPLRHYHDEEYGFLSPIVTGDETWGHHFEPESKSQSKHWKRAISPPPKKSKAVHASSSKVMMSFFTRRAHCLSSFWNGEPPSMTNVIKPLYRILDEPSNRNAQACCPMTLFSYMINVTTVLASIFEYVHCVYLHS